MKLSTGHAFLSGVRLGSLERTEVRLLLLAWLSLGGPVGPYQPYLCFRICLLSSMVTLSVWSLLKISKASWRPKDISSLIPVGNTGKRPQSQHQDPISCTVTLLRLQSQPRLQEAHSREGPTRQVASGSSSWLPTRGRSFQ